MMIVVVAVIVNIGKGVFVRQDIINAKREKNKQQSTTHFNESRTQDIDGGGNGRIEGCVRGVGDGGAMQRNRKHCEGV